MESASASRPHPSSPARRDDDGGHSAGSGHDGDSSGGRRRSPEENRSEEEVDDEGDEETPHKRKKCRKNEIRSGEEKSAGKRVAEWLKDGRRHGFFCMPTSLSVETFRSVVHLVFPETASLRMDHVFSQVRSLSQ